MTTQGGGGSRRAPQATFGGLDELIRQAWAHARHPGLSAPARREALAYARGLEQAVYVLTGVCVSRLAQSTGPMSP